MAEYLSLIVEQHGLLAILASLGVGVITSVAPCSIAGVPLIAGFSANINIGNNPTERSKYTRNFTFIFVSGIILSISILFFLMTQFKYFISFSPLIGYLLAGILCFYVAISALGLIQGMSLHHLAKKFARFNLAGAFAMGILIGLVSTPCASPALASILIVAQNQSSHYALALVMAFAIGHCFILILSGLSMSFVKYMTEKKSLTLFSKYFQSIMAITLLGIGSYFFFQAITLGIL